MSLKKVTLVLLFFGFFYAYAVAGPFGLEMGMSLQAIGGNPQEIGIGIYRLETVPKPHSAFEYYVVKIAPKGGLCWIKAVGKDINTNVFGFEIKAAVDELENKLTENYGKHKRMDFLIPGSIWDEPKDWMMGLKKKERFLGIVWERAYGSSLPNEIKQIGLVASALSPNKGFINVEYSFVNIDSCEAELAAQEDDAL